VGPPDLRPSSGAFKEQEGLPEKDRDGPTFSIEIIQPPQK
jgi:hypothetical protein